MSKIINFSSMNEGMFVSDRINNIKKELKKETLSRKKLRDLEDEIHYLSLFLTKKLHEQANLTQIAMSLFLSQQAELSCLIFACQNLYIDKRVNKLTQHAQKIAKESQDPYKNVSQKIEKLKKSIHSLAYQEALSLENRQMINLAKNYLNDAKEHRYSHDLSKNANAIRLEFKKENCQKDFTDPYETSISLYEIAGNLYHHELKEAFALFYSLSPSLQKALKEAILKVGGNFDLLKNLEDLEGWKKNLYPVIQALIGYTNEMIYGTVEYPSIKEVNNLFKDLDAIRKTDISANF